MAERRRKRALERDLRYWELMGNGEETVEACQFG